MKKKVAENFSGVFVVSDLALNVNVFCHQWESSQGGDRSQLKDSEGASRSVQVGTGGYNL